MALALGMGFVATPCRADPINLLVNPGFETGDFSGWTVIGTTIQFAVARDQVPILNAEPPFPPNVQNVRSGQFAANALLSAFAEPVPERIVLQQTIQVPTHRMLQIGFWIGNDSQSDFGMNLGPLNNLSTQMLVDGSGILPDSFTVVKHGSTTRDFMLISGPFQTGLRTEVGVAFSITGSGSSRVGASLDDFFVSEATPEPSAFFLLGTGAVAALLCGRARAQRLIG